RICTWPVLTTDTRWMGLWIVTSVPFVESRKYIEWALVGGTLLRVRGWSAQMSVLEVVVILQAVSQKPIESDVGEPHEAEGENETFVPPPPEPDQEGRQRCAVRQVVRDCPET